jgi:hypothetical protein
MQWCLAIDVGIVDICLLLLDEGNYFVNIRVVDGMQK